MNQTTRCIVVLASGLLLLACSFAAATSTAVPPIVPPPTVEQPEPTVTLASVEASPTAAPIAPPQELQPCTLVTAAEAEAILGEPVAPPQDVGGACAFGNARDSLYVVSVAAAQEEQTEGILEGQAFLLGIAGAPLDQAKLEQLQALSAAQDFRGFFTELVGAAQGVPAVQAELVDGVGDVGYWAWLETQDRRQGAFVVARGPTLVNVNLVVADSQSEQAMLDASKALADQVFDRLPVRFVLATPTAVPTQVPPTPEPTEPPPTATPVPPPPAATFTPTAEDPNAPPPGFVEQPSYTGDCSSRPAGSICLGYDDGYVWFLSPFNDSVLAWGEAGSWMGKKIQVIFGAHADYHHILGTNLVKMVNK